MKLGAIYIDETPKVLATSSEPSTRLLQHFSLGRLSIFLKFSRLPTTAPVASGLLRIMTLSRGLYMVFEQYYGFSRSSSSRILPVHFKDFGDTLKILSGCCRLSHSAVPANVRRNSYAGDSEFLKGGQMSWQEDMILAPAEDVTKKAWYLCI